MIPLAVTVSALNDPSRVQLAQQAARRLGLPYLERARKSGLTFDAAAAFLVLGGDGWVLRDPHGDLPFSPGLARLRIKRLEQGLRDDVLVRLGELKAGDQVLDCTFGLGADAQVCARAVGPTGSVVALEASLPLWALGACGLSAQGAAPDSCAIEPRHADAAVILPTLPCGSFDCVLFDPMFGRPKKASPAFDMLRRYANHAPLSLSTLAEARRVARRWVVVKGARYSDDLKRLGLVPEPTSRFSEVVWARVAPRASPH